MLRLRGMITLMWPSSTATHAEIWRLLDLSGLVRTEREARIAINSRLCYINNTLVSSFKQTVPLNDSYTLELRTGRRTKEITFLLVNRLFRTKGNRPENTVVGNFRRG